jgi:hypothetical protein
MVSGLFPNAVHNVSGFSLPSVITDSHHLTEKLLSMAKKSKKKRKISKFQLGQNMYLD